MSSYRVSLESKVGCCREFYSGSIDVTADNEDDAVEVALNQLKRTSFPDRPRSSWIVKNVDRTDGYGRR